MTLKEGEEEEEGRFDARQWLKEPQMINRDRKAEGGRQARRTTQNNRGKTEMEQRKRVLE